MDYFKHDINASEDDKICDLLAAAGYEMLGYYWRFIEYLYSRGGKVAKNKLDSVAWALHMEKEKLEYLVSAFGLFYDDGECVCSKRVVEEFEEFEANGKRMSNIGRIGGKASAQARAKAHGEADAQAYAQAHAQADAQASAQAHGEAYAQADAQQNKKKKEKKENKENIICHKHKFGFFENVFLSDEEIKKLSVEVPNYNDYIDRLSNYIENTGKNYKSHCATIMTWYRNDIKNKPPVKAEKSRDPNKKYDDVGRELNEKGYPIIDFGLSKSNIDF